MRNQAFISGLAILLYFSPLSCQSVEFTSPEFREVIAENAQVVAIATELQFTEGPVWIDSSAGKPGYLLFSDIPANIIYRFSAGDTLSVWRSPSGNSNGLILDAAGRLITCEHGNRRVGISDVPGPVNTLCESFRGLALNSPNDAAIGADGGIWFTDPPYGIKAGEQQQPANFVFSLAPGKKEPRAMIDDFDRPNGIVFSPDKKILYVSDSGRPRQVRHFRLEGDSLSEIGVFAKISPGGPDGMCVDNSGRLYVTTGDGVQVFSPEGKLLGKVLTPKQPTNCCFGGDEMQTLFITARPNVYMVRLKVQGLR